MKTLFSPIQRPDFTSIQPLPQQQDQHVRDWIRYNAIEDLFDEREIVF